MRVHQQMLRTQPCEWNSVVHGCPWIVGITVLDHRDDHHDHSHSSLQIRLGLHALLPPSPRWNQTKSLAHRHSRDTANMVFTFFSGFFDHSKIWIPRKSDHIVTFLHGNDIILMYARLQGESSIFLRSATTMPSVWWAPNPCTIGVSRINHCEPAEHIHSVLHASQPSQPKVDGDGCWWFTLG